MKFVGFVEISVPQRAGTQKPATQSAPSNLFKFVDIFDCFSISLMELHFTHSNIVSLCNIIESDSIEEAQIKYDENFKKINIFFGLTNPSLIIRKRGGLTQIPKKIINVDFDLLIKYIDNDKKVSELENQCIDRLRSLYRPTNFRLFINSFAEIVNILDLIQGKNKSTFCCVRNIIEHKGENKSNHQKNIQKAKNLGFNFEIEEGIFVENQHNSDELLKKRDELVALLMDNFIKKYIK